jgi:hypothetical protein
MYVFPTASVAVGYAGGVIHLSTRDVWAADDPFVRARPELFSDTPTGAVVRRTAPAPVVVEQATAAPGEKRKTPGRG